MTIRIGANPIGWSNDDMRELGGEISLQTCLSEAKQAGFSGMELGHKFPREPAALRAALAPFDLACVSGWHSAGLLRHDAAAELRQLRPHLDLLKAMGSSVLVFAETSNAIHGDIATPLSRRPVLQAGQWAEFGRRMSEVADATLREGVRLVYHHHMGTVVQDEADIDALMAVFAEDCVFENTAPPPDGDSHTAAYVAGGLAALALALAGGFLWYRRRLP